MNHRGIIEDQLSQRILSIRPDIPVVICTGFSQLIDEERVIQLGINALLMKPVERATLAKVIRRTLDSAVENS